MSISNPNRHSSNEKIHETPLCSQRCQPMSWRWHYMLCKYVVATSSSCPTKMSRLPHSALSPIKNFLPACGKTCIDLQTFNAHAVYSLPETSSGNSWKWLRRFTTANFAQHVQKQLHDEWIHNYHSTHSSRCVTNCIGNSYNPWKSITCKWKSKCITFSLLRECSSLHLLAPVQLAAGKDMLCAQWDVKRAPLHLFAFTTLWLERSTYVINEIIKNNKCGVRDDVLK